MMPSVESLESRELLALSSPALAVTIPGPLPATEIAGAKVNLAVPVTIANSGTVGAIGKFTIQLYAIQGSSSTPLTSAVKRSLDVAVGGSDTVKLTLPSFPSSLRGDYTIRATVKFSQKGFNASLTGESSTRVDLVGPTVDLTGTIVNLPSTATLGQTFPVSLVVKNSGTATAHGSLDVLFEYSASETGSNPFQVANIVSAIDLKPAQSAKLNLKVPLALGSPSGYEYIVAVVDPMDVFNESNTSDKVSVSARPVDIVG